MCCIYMASEPVHAPRWRRLRAEGLPIVAPWIDETDGSERSDPPSLWRHGADVAASADCLILYREPGETAKIALVEANIVLLFGVPVYAVGCDDLDVAGHAGVTPCANLDDALGQASRLCGGHAPEPLDEPSRP